METSSAASSFNWFSELESAMDDLPTAEEVLRFQECLSSEDIVNSSTFLCSSYPAPDHNRRPSKLLKWSSNSDATASFLQNSPSDHEDVSDPAVAAAAAGSMNNAPPLMVAAGDQDTVYSGSAGGSAKSSTYKRGSHAQQDHIMAERRRREKLSERFIALSALVPGLKKMDKASVLGDAVKYMKQLQEQVKSMEEQSKKRVVESVVYVRKSQLSSAGAGVDESSSCEDYSEGSSDGTLPEIEAKVSGGDVLIRVHCEKQNGVVTKILAEIEKLHLSVVNTSVLPFGNFTLDMTIIAQKDDRFERTNMGDLVKELRVSFQKFM